MLTVSFENIPGIAITQLGGCVTVSRNCSKRLAVVVMVDGVKGPIHLKP